MNPFLRARDLLRPVDRTPTDVRDSWIHHGFRIALVLLVAISVPLLFPRDTLPEFEGLVVGMVADRDVIAEVAFPVRKSEEVIQSETREALAALPLIIAKDTARAGRALGRAEELFTRLDSAASAIAAAVAERTEDPEEARRLLLDELGTFADANGLPYQTAEELEVLADPEARDLVIAALRNAFTGPLRNGVIRTAALSDAATRRVYLRAEGLDLLQSPDTIPTMESFLRDALASVSGSLPSAATSLYNAILVQFAEPTLLLDAAANQSLRDGAIAGVETAAGYVQEGQRIITQYEAITEQDAQELRAYQEELVRLGRVSGGAAFVRALGMTLLAASVLGILVFTTFAFRREIYADLRSYSVLLFLVFLVLAAAGVIATVDWPPALIPVAFAAILVAGLFDAFIAVVVVCAISGILLGQPAFEGLAVPMLTAAGGVTAAFALREVRRRSQSWVLIMLITASYVLTGLCLKMIGTWGWPELFFASVMGFSNATICAALAMGAVLPALELFTRRTTEQTLLELADMNRPLLRRLAREAPGTYAHSINMANLVEAACTAIGADSLLARVGVYYHDIGKLNRPQFFIENQPKGLNPHDRLLPSQSAEILRAHVRDGIVLADEARLPRVVKNFIREHHGTQRIEFFFAKALREQGSEALDPNDFCYPGPKPQTKETAIAMLADSVEAATRVLADPSPERIRVLIQKLADARVAGGQFDECGLTFRDLDRVKREFARVLTGLYHHRIDYPDPAPRPSPHRVERAPRDGSAAEPFTDEPVEPDERPERVSARGRSSRRPGSPQPEPVEVPHEAGGEQMTIDLALAAQSDTGPPPDLDAPVDEEAGAPAASDKG
ncbi:MAG: HDIG domain-containing protein [Gemmatimonadota bacterium]|nr:HDIG domain-containing protein [Gemmatimonadota bacterium]